MTSLDTTSSNTSGTPLPGTPFDLSKPRTTREIFDLVRMGLGIAAVVIGLLATIANGMAWGYLLVGLWVGLLLWKPIHGILALYAVISVYPALRIISISLRPSAGLLSRSLDLIPPGATFQSYVQLFTEENFLLWLWNSLSVTVSVSLVGVTVAATSAYAFSRWRFPGRRPMLIFLLTTQMIPAGMMAIPLYVIAAQLNLRNQILGLMLAYIVTAVPFSVWILKGYYDTIPPDLEEAAMVDGCTRMEAFIRMILPLSTPALSIVFLFNFLGAWSEFIVAKVILQADTSYTWPLGFNSLIGTFNTDWGKYAAGAAIVTIPVLLLFVSQARYLISGLTLGSVKS
jgi:arabinogalactan oligomer / maltooligosaccharide transport system permease protein